MGNWSSVPVPEAPTPIFNVVEISKARVQATANEQLDGFDAACMKSEVNRRAMQLVEVCAPPPAAAEYVAAVPLFDWLRTIRTTKVLFFLEGLPHTREVATIYLPYDIVYEATFNKTMLHEAIHVHQRIHRDAWNAIFARAWDMRPWHGDLPAGLESRRRYNPDTHLEPLFIWRGHYVPVMVFRRADAPRLREAHCVWYNVETEGWEQVAPPGWREFFGTDTPSLCEHPNEMAAYILSDDSYQSAAKSILETAIRKEF